MERAKKVVVYFAQTAELCSGTAPEHSLSATFAHSAPLLFALRFCDSVILIQIRLDVIKQILGCFDFLLCIRERSNWSRTTVHLSQFLDSSPSLPGADVSTTADSYKNSLLH